VTRQQDRADTRTPSCNRPNSPDWIVNNPVSNNSQRYVIPRITSTVQLPSVASTWDLSLKVWPLEDRPEELQNQDTVNAMTLPTLFTFKQHYDALQKKEGKGETEFGLDRKLPTKHYKEEDDNTANKLLTMR